MSLALWLELAFNQQEKSDGGWQRKGVFWRSLSKKRLNAVFMPT